MSRIITVALIVVVTGVCFRLGIWQLERLRTRQQQNNTVLARSALPEITVTGVATDGLVEYRAASANGTFDFERQVVRVGRPMDGVPGVVVITPLVLDGGSAILVERGWAPSPDARRVDLETLVEPRRAEVTGIIVSSSENLFPLNEGWPAIVRTVNITQLANRYPYDLVPWVLRRTDPPGTAAEHVFRSVRTQPPSNGPHLSYAFQWFSFGLIALVGGYFLLFRRRSESTRVPETGLT